ncbi:MAG: alpha-hydroxy-acid oxidizing protein [Devosia nanyangense]|uniref:Alpha-hydroxy-acid oxidizing protein n=1 Tax=Devosia nanyangense TaxID=1228055 RepID=A0A933L196_9HYPH|nr:alpha-hydroxy-acid oxidizing protein [Devosia nanyangense]
MQILDVNDLMQLARRRVPKMFFDYADSGAFSESTYHANEAAFGAIKLRQRVGRKISNRSLASTMVGQKVAMPVALAPVGILGMQHANGEILAARAAESFGVPFTLSTMSVCSIEEVARATSTPFWFQLYVMRDRGFVRSLIDRAKAAGCSALVVTMDLQIVGQRHKDQRNGLSTPPRLNLPTLLQLLVRPRWCLQMLGVRDRRLGNLVGHTESAKDLTSMSAWVADQFDLEFCWDDIAWLRERWGGTLILKGIMTAEDAREATLTGADAIVVSNHGGRQLDGAPSTLSVLPGIVDAVGDQLEVHVDGGIRSGQDVFRALALGAKGTYIGRPYVYGLGAMGEAGVRRALEIIATELDVTMALCAERTIAAIGPHNLEMTASVEG